jgi:hypothetical protein
MRGPCQLFVKKMFATREECVREEALIQSVPVFFLNRSFRRAWGSDRERVMQEGKGAWKTEFGIRC